MTFDSVPAFGIIRAPVAESEKTGDSSAAHRQFSRQESRFRDPGGPYPYARTAIGPLSGLEVGWLRWLSALASFSANTILSVVYVAVLAPV